MPAERTGAAASSDAPSQPRPATPRSVASLLGASSTSGRLSWLWALTLLGTVLGGSLALASTLYLIGHDGGRAYDTQAYWLAGRRLLDGTALYSQATVSDLGAYKYPPVFAQVFVPAGLLPELLVAWLWRISGVLCLRYIVGSWRAAIVACAFIPVLTELSLGNVTLQLAAALVFAMRDRRGAYLLPWAVALKFGPALLVPFLWFRKPETRWPLVTGTVVFAAACLTSYVIAPGAWSDYVATYGWESGSLMSGGGVIALVPSWGGLDFALRFAIAGVVALYAVYSRRGWLAYAAAAVTCPVMAISRFAPLVGLWRFRPVGWPDTRRLAVRKADTPPGARPLEASS